MKLQEGVDLHFIPTDKFTTNTIKIRFAAPLQEKTVAGRVLVANMLEIANAEYPTGQVFRRQLANLYGARLSTSVSKRGQVHLIDITISFIREEYLLDHESLTEQTLSFLSALLFKPLAKKSVFDQELFDLEKRNLISYLESEIEDNFYHADLELNRLFYQDTDMQIPRVATKELVEKETAESVYQAYKNMLQLDKVDIFVVGQLDQKRLEDYFRDCQFSFRNPKLNLEYRQEFSSVTKEKVERKEANQSVLEMAYHLQILYNDVNYPALVVFNSLFGSSAHSKLFVNLREKEGLAYTIGSSLHIFSGMLRVYAGIDKENRLKTLQLIREQWKDMKLGNFTDEELSLTKKMLVNAATLAQDRVSTLVEQVYNQTIYGDDCLSYDKWTNSVNLVSREDVVKVAQMMKLQAVYFMEGVE